MTPEISGVVEVSCVHMKSVHSDKKSVHLKNVELGCCFKYVGFSWVFKLRVKYFMESWSSIRVTEG